MRIKNALAVCLAAMYLLGSHKGYLALWKEDRPEPFQIFPCPVDTLPEDQQAALKDGIRARSDLELAGLLENYLS